MDLLLHFLHTLNACYVKPCNFHQHIAYRVVDGVQHLTFYIDEHKYIAFGLNRGLMEHSLHSVDGVNWFLDDGNECVVFDGVWKVKETTANVPF